MRPALSHLHGLNELFRLFNVAYITVLMFLQVVEHIETKAMLGISP